MKSSAILREAARTVEQRGWGCGCRAIAIALDRDAEFWKTFYWVPPEPIASHFKLLMPARKSWGEAWWSGPKKHDARIIGLCLAAAIAESEGD